MKNNINTNRKVEWVWVMILFTVLFPPCLYKYESASKCQFIALNISDKILLTWLFINSLVFVSKEDSPSMSITQLWVSDWTRHQPVVLVPLTQMRKRSLWSSRSCHSEPGSVSPSPGPSPSLCSSLRPSSPGQWYGAIAIKKDSSEDLIWYYIFQNMILHICYIGLI